MKQGMRMGALATGLAVALALGGCAADMKHGHAVATAEQPMAKEFFVVLPENGRLYAFGDTRNYFDFLNHGEVALTRTHIGAGPDGKTIVYGITKDDVKQNRPSLAEQVWAGKLAPAPDFHGEVFKDGRYYVFGNLKDMLDFTAFGEVPYSYTDIGAAADGRTLVWVMNKESYKKGRPVATIERYKALRASAG
jgi:hypothetical protein